MYCNHCGKEINDNAVECPYCGGDTKNTHNNDYGTPYVSDNGGIGWGATGMLYSFSRFDFIPCVEGHQAKNS